MSAEIIWFMPRPKHNRAPASFPRLASRSTSPPDDLAMDHADTTPCEYAPGSDPIDPEPTRPGRD